MEAAIAEFNELNCVDREIFAPPGEGPIKLIPTMISPDGEYVVVLVREIDVDGTSRQRDPEPDELPEAARALTKPQAKGWADAVRAVEEGVRGSSELSTPR